jgi:hypothetical protein
MKRMELIANRSVETEIIAVLEDNIKDFYYTLLPQINGRGKTKYRLGTATWPELNFLLISYLDDVSALKAKTAIHSVKEKFPKEGIKLFIMEADLV